MTRLIEILISLAIVAVLFLVVGLVLPSSRHVTESIETNRKMTIVRDTLTSPRRFKEWNTLALRDPRMEWKFFGPDTGVGAGFEYASTNKMVGSGKWTLTKNDPNQIEYQIVDSTRGTNKKTSFFLKPTGRNNRNVEVMQTYDVDYGFDLLGRYSGLYVRAIGDDIKLGLGKFTNMLADWTIYLAPVATLSGSSRTEGHNHAGTGRPAHPYPATGTGYEKGNEGCVKTCRLWMLALGGGFLCSFCVASCR